MRSAFTLTCFTSWSKSSLSVFFSFGRMWHIFRVQDIEVADGVGEELVLYLWNALTSVHNDITNTDNDNNSKERPIATPIKVKRSIIPTNDLPSPVTNAKKNTEKKLQTKQPEEARKLTERRSATRVRRRSTGNLNHSLQCRFALCSGLRPRIKDQTPRLPCWPVWRALRLLNRSLFFLPTTMSFYSRLLMSWWVNLLSNGRYVLLVLLTLKHPRPQSSTM